ncbi:hypothetical protein M0804_013472 [Polistes exclamans]|nr:hypothetical protein M0804_013472 [Polistes exclamans]
MGNPASPVLANIVMNYILKKVEGMLPFQVPFLKLVFYNLVKIKSIYTKLKDKDDKLEQSNLVYKIPCECEKCYIGQTKQKLKKRLEQHRNDSKPKNAQKTNTTALAEHHFKTGHNFKFDETKILDKEDNCLEVTSSVRKGMVE